MSLPSRVGKFFQSSFSNRVDASLPHAACAKARGRRGRSQQGRLFEFLEQRQLLSSLSITGNGVAITDGSTTPSVTTNTDFMSASTTNNSALGYATRTYIIQNTTASEIDLTGGSNLIQISGADAGDFTVTSEPTAAIAAGGLSIFTVQFLPQAAGARTATITIPNSSGDDPSFSFAVQGTGLVTTNAASGLEVATTTAGAGPVAAANGDVLQVSYTGYLLDGQVFDSTAGDGGTPFTFRLDDSTGQTYITDDQTGNTSVDEPVIDGWEQGLQGIKAGESRTLIIPSGLGYGATGSGTTIPANSTLIFDITCSTLGYSPELGVQGNSTDIPAGDTTPSTTDGTDFGALSNGQTSITHTFTLYDYSDADSATGAAIDGLQVAEAGVTGTDAKDFSLVSGADGVFTLTYKPTAIGTQTAVVHFESNDAGHPDFTFTVSGSNPAYDDLTTSIAKTKLPTSVVSGDGTKLSIPVTVTNQGNTAIAKGAVTSVQVFLTNANTGTQTPLVASIASTSVSSLGAHKSKSFTETVTIPASTAADVYELMVSVNANGVVHESDTVNDSATTAQTMSVATGFYDLAGALISSKLPTTVIAGQPVKGVFAVSVKNASNIVLPKGQNVTIEVLADNTSTGVETTLLSKSESLSALKAGLSHSFSLTVNDVAGLAAGTYRYQAELIAAPALTESNNSNNLLLTTASGQVFEAIVKAAFNNVTGALSKSTLKVGAAAIAGTVSLKVQNAGNVALPANQLFQVQIIAHPVGAADNSADVVLQQSAAFSLKKWKAGQSATFSVPVKFAGTLAAGNYTIEATLVPVPTLVESSVADNLLTTTAAGQPLILAVA
jgi:hypothetical protein